MSLLTLNRGEGGANVMSADFFDALGLVRTCLLYTSDAADERSSVDLGGRRIIKKKKQLTIATVPQITYLT